MWNELANVASRNVVLGFIGLLALLVIAGIVLTRTCKR